MSVKRKLFTVVALAVTAFAFVVSAASAQAPIEALNEATGEHCSAVTVTGHEATGDCLIVAHDIQSSHLAFPGVLLSQGGTPLSICGWEFEAYVAENGNGMMTHQQITDVGPPIPPGSCSFVPCQESGAGTTEPWPFTMSEVSAGLERLRFFFCVSAGGAEATPCRLDFDVTRDGHDYIFSAEDKHCFDVPTAPEFTGEWMSEGESSAELTHNE